MAAKSYVWQGPQTLIEIFEEGSDAPKPIYSGHVKPGTRLPVQIDENHSLIKSWLAFKLIGEAPPEPAATITDQQVSAEPSAALADPAMTEARRTRKKENSDG